MDNPVSEISFTIDAKKGRPIANTGLTLDSNDLKSDKKITDESKNKELEKDLDIYLPNYKRKKKKRKRK